MQCSWFGVGGVLILVQLACVLRLEKRSGQESSTPVLAGWCQWCCRCSALEQRRWGRQEPKHRACRRCHLQFLDKVAGLATAPAAAVTPAVLWRGCRGCKQGPPHPGIPW